MDTLQAIKARKSYRGSFRQEPIPREDLRELVEAGFLAPSGCNMQITQFIAVDDPELVKQLAEYYGRDWAKSAPAAILILTSQTPAPSGEIYSIHDYSAAAENILLAVTAKGYATTWIEGQLHHDGIGEKMAKLMGVPDNMSVAVYLPIGIPAETVKEAKKLPFEERAWFNGYKK